MKVNVQQIKKNRIYSEEFKREIVSLFEKGTYSVLQLSRLYKIPNSAIYRWIYKFSIFNEQGQRIVEMKASNTNKVKELEAKVKELERIVGQKQIQVDFYSKVIEIASKELDYDIIKNSNTLQSPGSVKKEQINYSLNSLYRTIGISKQAVNQYAKKQAVFDTEVSKLVLEADDLRREHPGCGVEKMYYTLKPSFIGRDKFIDVFMNLGYRLHKRKNYIKTTIASKIYYPNLIKGMQVNAPSTIWQSDITYIRIKDVFYYAVFIIDVYTKKIVGYHVSDNMRAQANIEALKMAFKYNTPPLIHHSDRGSQYTYKGYIQLLKTKGVNISMALSAQDNAYAERINRTIKNDYLAYWKPKSFCELKRLIKKAVNQYNNTRPHNSIDKMTPVEFENKWFGKSTFSKPFITIFNNEVNV